MTDSGLVTTPKNRFDLSRAKDIIFRPRQAFEDLAAQSRPNWLTPMIVLSVTAALVVAVSGFLTARAAMQGEVTLPPDWQYWTADMQNNYMQAQQAMQGPAFVYIIPLVGALTGLWLGWLILSGLLHLGSTLLGGRGTMQLAFTIVGWASLPYALRDILRVVFMGAAGHSISSPGLSGFAGDVVFLAQVLARLDLFVIWSIILLIIGFRIGDGLQKGKAFILVLVVTVLILLAQAGVGTLMSGLGGIMVQRPF